MKSSLALLLLVFAPVSIATAQSAGTFTPTGNMTTVREAHTATMLPSGKVLIAGGTDGHSTIDSAETYDPSTGTFTATGRMTTSRAGHAATLLANGKVLIAGGTQTLVDGFGIPLSSAEIYDPATEIFSPAGNMSVDRGFPTATLLANGKILIAGGTFLASPLELYDPSTGTFTTSATTMPLGVAPGEGGAATLLADGTVFFATLPYGSLGGGVVYSPATDTFSYRGDLGSGYSHHAVSLLPDGKLLTSGGGDLSGGVGSILAGAQLYDPSTGGFARTGKMATCRFYHTSTLFPNGTALIAGGFTTASDGICSSADLAAELASAELYDPSTGVFTATGEMSTPRSFHTATLLNDGTVLIAGGVSATAEIYHPLVLTPAATVFSLSGNGRDQGAIWNGVTGRIASAADPAAAGDVLSMYTTSLFEGGVIPPQVAVGGQHTETLFFGDAPGYPGYFQVNFRVPNGVAPGSSVTVRLNYIGRPSNTVTIGVH